jgi:hypothetical protein
MQTKVNFKQGNTMEKYTVVVNKTVLLSDSVGLNGALHQDIVSVLKYE